MKKLEEMSLEELWQLFPIALAPHRDCWERWFEEERARLLKVFPPEKLRWILHIGSTSVKGIWAKPIVDILAEAAKGEDLEELAGLAKEAGYREMSRGEGRISLNKGYTPLGFEEKVFHLHLRRPGDHDELYFRDHIRAHAGAAREYERLKLELWPLFEHNRDGYTEGKGDMIRAMTKRGKEEFAGRYERREEGGGA